MGPEDTSQRQSHGYVLDVPYTWSFFHYQSPILLSYVAWLNGRSAPDPRASFTHVDLGCGNGVTTNLLAAAYPHARFYGIDFNADHIVNAQKIADDANLDNATFIEASFDELDRFDLPQFDYITTHGVYSWVSAEVRAQVDAVIDKMLKPGGLVYLCYNTLPGAASLVPLWKMMQFYSRGADGDIQTRASAAVDAINEMRNAKGRFFRENPTVESFFDRMMARDPRYLVHEFSNANYEPLYFTDVAQNFGAMDLDFAGTAKIYRNNPRNYLSSKHRALLETAQTREEWESRASFLRNESFRLDVFQRRASSSVDQVQPIRGLQDMYVGEVRKVSDQAGDIEAGRRNIDPNDEVIRALIEIAGPGQFTIGELQEHPELKRFGFDVVYKTVHDLIAAEFFQPLLSPYATEVTFPDTIYRMPDAVNMTMARRILVSEGKIYFSSPISGSAMRLNFTNGLLACLTHENRLADVPHLFAKALSKTGEENGYRFVSRKDAQSSVWREKKIDAFMRRYLPRLIRLNILSPA